MKPDTEPTHAEVMAAVRALAELAEQTRVHTDVLNRHTHLTSDAGRLLSGAVTLCMYASEALRSEEANTPEARDALEAMRLRRMLGNIRQDTADAQALLARARNPERRAELEARLARLVKEYDRAALRLHELETTR